MTWTVWSDGSGTTGGPAGIGFYAACPQQGDEFSGALSLKNATNQQAELLAAAYALVQLHEQRGRQVVTLVSDSEYVVKGWNEFPRRRRKKNLRHWARLTAAVGLHERVTFEWTRGHVGTEGNEVADMLAGAARQQAIEEAAA